jgi:hypothetical protein
MDIIHVVNSPVKEEETNCVGGEGKARASVV